MVGIGASAGGLTALRTFFSQVPESSGVAWVVIIHLAPEHPSHLADVLQPYVRMPVQPVTETVPLEADHVYVIPPGANLNAVDTHLRLSQLEETRRQRALVDHFFRTLSQTHDSQSVGVILTGTGSDGSLGIKAIKERNGLTVVQEPTEAEYDGMPRSAISTGMVDLVLPLEQIPKAVLRFARTEPRIPVTDEEALEAEVVPALFDGKGPQDSVRVWSVGCATGEEAYSLARLLGGEVAVASVVGAGSTFTLRLPRHQEVTA